MGNTDDHRWNLNEGSKGCTSEGDDAFEEKLKEWQARDWMDWLGTHLTWAFWPRRSSSNRRWLAHEIGQQPVSKLLSYKFPFQQHLPNPAASKNSRSGCIPGVTPVVQNQDGGRKR
jgi:hypothetical protein